MSLMIQGIDIRIRSPHKLSLEKEEQRRYG